MEEFKKVLRLESNYQLSEESMDEFLGQMKLRKVARGENVITAGEINPDI